MAYFGVDINLATSDPSTACTRLGSDSAFTALGNGSAAAVTYCSSVAPWGDIKRCNVLDDGTITNIHGDACYTDTAVADYGQVMVYYPAFMYYVDASGWSNGTGHVRYYISNNLAGTDQIGGVTPSWARHPAFVSNSANHSSVFVAAYEAYKNTSTNLYESKANVQPANNMTMAAARTAAARAQGWGIQTAQVVAMQQLLYLIEYATRNSQSQVSMGISTVDLSGTTGGTGNYQQLTGYTSSSGQTSAVDLANATGQVSFTTAYYPASGPTVQNAMSYRGVENLWGNLWKWTDGINLNTDRTIWVADHGFASNLYASPYAYSGITMPANTGSYLLEVVDATHTGYQWLFLPWSGQTMDYTHVSTWYSDWIEAIGGAVPWRQGGSFHDQYYCGLFMQGGQWSYLSSTYDTGARLMYLPVN